VDVLKKLLAEAEVSERLALLQELPLTRDKDPSDFTAPSKVIRSGRRVTLHRLFVAKEVPRHYMFYQQGEKNPADVALVSYVVHGEVQMKSRGLIVETVSSGAVLGEDATHGDAYSHTAVCCSDRAKVLQISVADYLHQFGKPSDAAQKAHADNKSARSRKGGAPRAFKWTSELSSWGDRSSVASGTQVAKQVAANKKAAMRDDLKGLIEQEWHLLKPKRLPKRRPPPGTNARRNLEEEELSPRRRRVASRPRSLQQRSPGKSTRSPPRTGSLPPLRDPQDVVHTASASWREVRLMVEKAPSVNVLVTAPDSSKGRPHAADKPPPAMELPALSGGLPLSIRSPRSSPRSMKTLSQRSRGDEDVEAELQRLQASPRSPAGNLRQKSGEPSNLHSFLSWQSEVDKFGR